MAVPLGLCPQTGWAGSLVQSWVGVKPPLPEPSCDHVAARTWWMKNVGCVLSFPSWCLCEALRVRGSHWVSACGGKHLSGCWRASALSYRRTNRPDLSERACGQDFDDCVSVKLGEEWMCFPQTVWIWPCWRGKITKDKQRIWQK